jgi:acyl transferase domain-containing protein/acyl carrier protein
MEPIAIVGMSCRFPGAPSLEAFWELLCNGVDAIREVPPERWNAADFYAPDVAADGKMNSRWGGFIDDVDRFDPHPFRIAPREAARMDPQQRLLLELAWEALEHAGQVRSRLAGSATGVFIGIGGNDYGRMLLSDPRFIDSYTNTGNAWCIAANRLSYVFDLRGPSIAIDSACSSSLIAIHQACQSLLAGESTLALAGGVNLILSPEPTIGFSKLSALSPDGRCKPFSATANGYVRGEGAGLVVLKTLARAEADGDPIHAVIRGSAVNQDGRTNGLTAPNRFSQEQVLRQAYQVAGVDPAQVQYVEAHGTGTLLGDPIEAQALGSVLSTNREPDSYCLVGSVKSNFGHLEPAAGIAGLIKTVLMLEHRLVPPSLHAEVLNPHIPFERLPLRVARQLEPWPSSGDARLAGVSAFSFGGTNAHIVLQSAPQTTHDDHVQMDGPYLLPVSAHAPHALTARARDIAQQLRDESLSLSDVAYTLATRRTPLDHRAAVVGTTREQIVAGLESLAIDSHGTSSMRRLALVFSGQPGAWLLNARELYADEPAFRAALDACHREVLRQTGASLLSQLATASDCDNAPDVVLFAMHVALYALFRAWGIEAEAFVGDGAGRVTAAHISGALSLEEAVRELRQPTGSVQGDDLPSLIEAGFDVFLEVGPSSAMAATLIRGARVPVLQSGVPVRADLLEALGRLFSLGIDLDWSALYPSHGACVPLPSYPWQRERLWVDIPQVSAAMPRSAPDHPLLGRRLRSALADIQFELEVSADSPGFLGDHRITGAQGPLAVMPGAGYIAMVLTAAQRTLGMQSCVLEDVLFLQPLALAASERRTVQLIVAAAPAQRRYFQVASIGADTAAGEQAWTLHATGHLCPLEQPAMLDLQPARERCSDAQAGAHLYAALEGAGYRLGPNFQWFETLWRGDHEAIGSLRLPAASEVDGFEVHPGVVDASLQLVGYQLLTTLAGGNAADETFVPISVQRVTYGGQPDGRLTCHVTAEEPLSAQRDVLGGDARLVDASGRVVIGLEGLRGKRVRRAELFERRPISVDELLYGVSWEETPRSSDAPAPTPQRWLILADEGGTGAALATELSRRGQQCELIYATTSDELGGVLNDGSGWNRVVSLWGLDQDSEPSASTMKRSLGSALRLVQALATSKEPPRVWLVTRGVHAVCSADEAVAPAQSPLWGLSAVIAHEYPRLTCTALDLDPSSRISVESLAVELLEADDEDRLALRGGRRYAPRLHRAPDAVRALDRLSPDATYLVTGGLGALGLRVARWMVDRGARHLVLVGRRGAHGDAAFRGVDELERCGAQVLVGRADVADPDALATLLDEVHRTLPPLRGVVHAAGILDDGMLLGQDWPRFERSLRPKVDGAWNLHRLTQSCQLDFFVLFSSIASLLGSPGQSSYAAANAFQDALASYRRGRGLPALSVNWGPWDKLGMAAAGPGAARGVQPLSEEQALGGLSAMLASDVGQVGVLSVSWPRLVEQLAAGSVPPLLANLVSLPKAAPREPWLAEQLRKVPVHEWHDWLTSHVQDQVSDLLELGRGHLADVNRGLFDLGMDSLVAMELKNRLETALGAALPPTLAFEYPTIDALAGYVAERLRPSASPTSTVAPAPAPSPTGTSRPTVTPPPAVTSEPNAATSAAAPQGADVSTLLAQVNDLSDDDALRLLLG